MGTYNQAPRPPLKGGVPATRKVTVSPDDQAARLERIERQLKPLQRMELAGRSGRVFYGAQSVVLP